MKKYLLSLLIIVLNGLFAFAQGQVVGTVTDSERQPIIGATVQEKGTGNFAITDLRGAFAITPQQKLPFTLQISAVGSKRQEVEVYEVFEEPFEINLRIDNMLSEVKVTARRRNESAQDVPIPISVVGGAQVEATGAFNVNRIKELVPSLQLYSSNPRNTGINIRGLGSPFGLTNDGLDPGVGFYVDGVYYARPAITTLDFIDIEQIEVLRGPQGTLFGKNTTAGAFNITTRRPEFTPGANFEVSFGNYGFIQAKTSITGAIIQHKLAARLSVSGTQRDGLVFNIAKDEWVNDMNNFGLKGQMLFTPVDKVKILLSADDSRQNPNGYAQIVAGVVETQRPEYRQFNSIISDLNYSLPSLNAFDRIIDHDTPWRLLNELGGASLTADIEIGKGTLTSTTAWRYWNWGPSNDRDFTGLQALAKSQNLSEHRNWSQEIRYAGVFSALSGVIGVFMIGQELETNGIEESGTAQWRFSQNSTSGLWKTPGLLEGYGASTHSLIRSFSAAVFANLDWAVTDKFHVLPGVRLNYDEKDVSYKRMTYGGLDTNDPELIALKNAVYQDQFFVADADETNFTYQLTLSYKTNHRTNLYATYSTAFKPIGVNVAGLPVIDGEVAVALGTIKPEYVKHLEAGVKAALTDELTLNLSFYNTGIDNYQTNVQSPQLGVNRGYIANAEEVNVKGIELDANYKLKDRIALFGALSYTDANYASFTNAPLPLEEVGATLDGEQLAFKDISGTRLPGISKWAGSFGAEFSSKDVKFIGQTGKVFIGADNFFRSEFSSSPSPSKFLNIDGYALLNGRFGFRASEGLTITFWARNLTDKDYFEQLLPAGGSAGHYAAVLGDPRTYGTTLKYVFQEKKPADR